MCTVTIDEKSYTCQPDESVLDTLLREISIFLMPIL